MKAEQLGTSFDRLRMSGLLKSYGKQVVQGLEKPEEPHIIVIPVRTGIQCI
jgi:hypothetical protein